MVKAAVVLVAVVFGLAVAVASAEVHHPELPRDQGLASWELVTEWKFSAAQNRLSFTAYGRNWQFGLQSANVTGGPNAYFRAFLIGGDGIGSFTIGEHEVSGLIIDEGLMYYLERAKNVKMLAHHDVDIPDEQLIIYNSNDVRSGSITAHCGSKQVPQHKVHGARNEPREPRGVKNLGVYIDSLYGSGAGPDIVGLINDINTVYINSGVPEFAITHLGDVGYVPSPVINNGLQDFSNWVASRADAHRNFDNVHLVTGRMYGWERYDGAVGLAYEGSSCNFARGQYTHWKTGISALMPQRNPNYNWVYFNRPNMIQLIAHELGHNRTPRPSTCSGDCAHDHETGCYVMSTPICDNTGGVVFRPSWAARMC